MWAEGLEEVAGAVVFAGESFSRFREGRWFVDRAERFGPVVDAIFEGGRGVVRVMGCDQLVNRRFV